VRVQGCTLPPSLPRLFSGNTIAAWAVCSLGGSPSPFWEEGPLPVEPDVARFEQVIVPHLDAAYNLARWLTGNDYDAQEVVQEASLRALQFFASFHGEAGRAWLLAIVRNTCFTWLKKHRGREPAATFDEDFHSPAAETVDPQELLIRAEDHELLHRALHELPVEFREAIVLRELEGLSYKEIADIAGIPVGTVMSRLARGRDRLQQLLRERMRKDV
jgi:RNA polymerase sigma-70 factor, ECF subfamily